MDKLIKRYKRTLSRLVSRKKDQDKRYPNNEQKYTFHGGYNSGYVEGRISMIEDVIDDLTEMVNND